MRNRKRNVAAALAAGVLLGLSNSAVAIPIHVSAGGFFREFETDLVPPGAEWSLDLVYESSTVDARPADASVGLYNAYQSLQLVIGSQLYTLADLTPSGSNIEIFNDRTTGGVSFRDVLGFRGSIANTLISFDLVASFGYPQPGGGVLSSDALLSDPAQLTAMFNDRQSQAWEFTDFVFFEIEPGQTSTDIFAVGRVDRFSAAALAVPEPGTLSLLSLSLLLLMRLRRGICRSRT
jgi:hypothetical protein